MMPPPQLAVALLQGAASVSLRSEGALKLLSHSGGGKTAGPGSITLSLEQAHRAAKEKWFWMGTSREQDLEGWLAQALHEQNLIVCFWPVGLTPAESQWQKRDYRVLVRPADERMGDDEFFRQQKLRRPEITPVQIDLPLGKSSGKVVCTFAGGTAPADMELPVAIQADGPMELLHAPIGQGFHWEHAETLELPSAIRVELASDGWLCVVADRDIEDYLASVNSSEMPAESPLEFLKAQVVAARSWLLANWGSHHPGEPFVVCAGDHCQCYYGPARIKLASRQAADSTRGEALIYDRRICDARYAKICGGFTEPGGHVWPFLDEPYLAHFRDLPDEEKGNEAQKPVAKLDLSQEHEFRSFQMRQESQDACCSPGYDQSGTQTAVWQGRPLADLYRWQETISLGDLREIILKKTGSDLGEIQDLVAGCRGPSGRLRELTIIGKKERLSVSPELEIRRVLSPTHLPSSAFWTLRTASDQIVLHGLGWGHGVGLCQVGAAALAARGYDYQRILAHYYPNSTLKKIY